MDLTTFLHFTHHQMQQRQLQTQRANSNQLREMSIGLLHQAPTRFGSRMQRQLRGAAFVRDSGREATQRTEPRKRIDRNRSRRRRRRPSTSVVILPDDLLGPTEIRRRRHSEVR